MRTSHGHEVPGTPVRPTETSRGVIVYDCGGMGACVECATEAVQTIIKMRLNNDKPKQMLGREPQPPAQILKYFFTAEKLYRPSGTINDTFGLLATGLDVALPPGPEKEDAMRKLLEARDASLRAIMWESETPATTEEPK